MSDPPGSPRHVSPSVSSRIDHGFSSSSPSSSPLKRHVLALDSPPQSEPITPQDFDHSFDHLPPLGPLPPTRSKTLPYSSHPTYISESSAVATTTISATHSRVRPRGRAPQLSERDSIFATHYLTGESNAGSPRFPPIGRSPNAVPLYHDAGGPMLLPGPLSPKGRRASSVDSIDIEDRGKMHVIPGSPPFSGISGTGLPVHGESGLSNELTQEQDGDRVTETQFSEGIQLKMRRRRSEEQIQATIAKEEPIGFARSRKASHYHGLFKSDSADKKEAKKGKDRVKESQDTEKGVELEDFSELDDRQRAAELEAETGVKVGSFVSPDSLQHGLPLSSVGAVVLQGSAIETSEHEDGVSQVLEAQRSVEWHSVGAPLGAYPIRLLEEIRSHPETQKQTKEKRLERPSSNTERQKSSESVKSRITPASDNVATLKISAGSGGQVDEEEDGEYSDKEHISAATYFPHQVPSPEDLDKGQEQLSGSYGEGLGEPAISVKSGLDGTDTDLPTRTRVPSLSAPVPKSKLDERKVVDRKEKVSATTSSSTLVPVDALEAESEDNLDDVQSDNEDDELADVEITPTTSPHLLPLTRKREPKAPLGAVELKPYKHQVGGHTKVFSFSKQAICKELNNKENAFYEVIERRHPELLEFMPRYLGVLNVTYTKAKRKRQVTEDSRADTGIAADESSEISKGHGVDGGKTANEPSGHERVISHSMNANSNEETVARVIYANNMHIIPSNLFSSSPLNKFDSGPRPQTAPTDGDSTLKTRLKDGTEAGGEAEKRPSNKERYPSWGATTVNQKLKERVLRDVFSPPVIHHRHRRQSVRKVFAHPPSGVEVPSGNPPRNGSRSRKFRLDPEETLSAAFLKTNSDAGQLETFDEEQRVGSAPSHNSTLVAKFKELKSSVGEPSADDTPPLERHVTRRRSDQGLQRKQCDADMNKRSELQYFETDDFQGSPDNEIFAMDLQNSSKKPLTEHSSTQLSPEGGLNESTMDSLNRSSQNNPAQSEPALTEAKEAVGHENTAEAIPEASPSLIQPSNPLEAQLQPDERVKHFLLLEDLTSGMNKPCVLDLKMGTRQYGIEATQKKRNSQQLKCKMTTSRQLGVRVCGMQRWDVKMQQPIFEDKYAGRDLRAGREFQNALRRFLHDGVSNSSVTRHIPVLLEKLSRLEQIIRNLPRYRFYASSLLMIYDAADLPSQKNIERGGHIDSESSGDDEVREGNGNAPPLQPVTSTIDIKLIDFANCVTSQTKRLAEAPCPPHRPNQPDRGYIRGLRSLRSYLQRIWQEVSAEEAESWMDRGDITQKSSGRTEHPEGWRKAGEGQGDEGEVSE